MLIFSHVVNLRAKQDYKIANAIFGKSIEYCSGSYFAVLFFDRIGSRILTLVLAYLSLDCANVTVQET